MTSEKTFVLIHGGWAGGWIWDSVRPKLEAHGHRVFAPSLPGMAERRDELSSSTNLSTHIADIESLIRDNSLSNVILVGNSYGGLVISGVADRITNGVISALVYLDALYLADKETFSVPPEFAENLVTKEINGAPCFLPLPSSLFGLEGDVAQHTDLNFSPFPIACLTEPPQITGARDQVKSKYFVTAKRTQLPNFKSIAKKLQDKDEWGMVEIDTDHLPMLETPDETASLLLKLATEENVARD